VTGEARILVPRRSDHAAADDSDKHATRRDAHTIRGVPDSAPPTRRG
jgi:hypothetical protein